MRGRFDLKGQEEGWAPKQKKALAVSERDVNVLLRNS
jgi:hypothetical protein